MAHSEACQLFIEQEIMEGLAQKKTPYRIGKDLAVWVEDLFETVIPANTLVRRAERIKENLTTNVVNPTTPETSSTNLEIQAGHGGARAGAGRPTLSSRAKKIKPIFRPTEAVYLANIAISQLSRIRDGDPEWGKGLNMVQKWLNGYRKRRGKQ